jgi:ABC-type antimicrobial peptide transport system permease subunit
MVLRHMLVLVAGGVAAGVSASWLLARWLSTVVFETDPASPILLGAVVSIVITAATAAALLPAVRASRVNPVAVLRAN